MANNKRVEYDIHQAYLDVFSTPSGQRVLEDLRRAHYAKKATFRRGLSVSEMAFNEGQRNVVLRIESLLETEPGKVTLVP